MLWIGCHLSSSKGYRAMGEQALALGANTFQFFTRNPRGSRAKAVDANDIAAYQDLARERGLGMAVAHAPYTLNPCSADPALREFARRVMAEDLATLEKLENVCYNLHPGSHTGQGTETGIGQIAEALRAVLQPGQKTWVLLETMAGKGSEVGSRFEELAEIIARVPENARLGVCLDSCHVYSAGYDLREDLEGVLEDFDRVIGLSRLKALHLNDSMTPFASHKDRQEKVGCGSLGLDTLAALAGHPALAGRPCILETPNDLPGYGAEIALLKENYHG